jgi:hypothetical protein
MGPFELIECKDASRVCRRCGEWIEPGPAFGRFRDKVTALHVDCAIDVDYASVDEALRRSTTRFFGRDSALARIKARFEAERDANRQTKGEGRAAIEPLKDRRGRPRVRVLYLQSTSLESAGDAAFFNVDSLCDFWHVRSSLREYALIEHAYPKHLRIDPAQPFAGALYWQRADGAVSNGNNKIVEWKALGLAAPVLAVVGEAARDEALRDKVVAKLRTLLARCGFEPDDAPVVTVIERDDATREALALALDEQAAKYTGTTEKRKSGRVFDAIEELFAQERDDGLAQAFVAAFKRFGRSRADERARVLERLVQFAKRSPEEAAKVFSGVERYDIALDRAMLHRVIEGLLSGASVSPQLGRWLLRWQNADGPREDTISPLLASAIERADARNAKKLRALGLEMGFLVKG